MIDLSTLRGKDILIAGATGLIGSHLAQQAGLAGANVYQPRAHGLDYRCLEGMDIVIHAAGYGQPSRFMNKPIETIQVNTNLTIHLLQCLKSGGTFLFCSSSEIYSGLHKMASESDIGTTTPQHPRGAYIEGKRAGEAIVHAYRNAGINAMSARIALAYGPGTKKHDTRVLNQFIEKALTKGKIELLDSGDATRTYCYIDDVVETLWSIILRGKQEVYNVGGYSVTSIANLAKRIGALTGAEVVIPEVSNGLIGAPSEVRMDLTRTKMAFWKTEYVDLNDGLDRTIQYQRGLYEQV
jgi:UDP-glucuronate decarboxylase